VSTHPVFGGFHYVETQSTMRNPGTNQTLKHHKRQSALKVKSKRLEGQRLAGQVQYRARDFEALERPAHR